MPSINEDGVEEERREVGAIGVEKQYLNLSR